MESTEGNTLECATSGESHKQTDTTDQTTTTKPNTAIKKQMKVVIGSLECILKELKSVVVDLRDVVVQIDDVTSQIEENTTQDTGTYFKGSTRKKTPNMQHKTRKGVRHSLDSGFTDNTSLISSSKSVRKSSQCSLNTYSLMPDQSFPVCGYSDRSRWSDNEVLPCGQEAATQSITSVYKKKPRRHSHNNTTADSILATAAQDETETLSNNMGSCIYSRVIKKPKQYSPFSVSAQTPNVAVFDSSSFEDLKGKTTSTGKASAVESDNCDFYERQLEQQLENLGGNHGNDLYKTDCFSTFDGLTKGHKSYSDTFCSMPQETLLYHTEDTAYESDSSLEGGTIDDRQQSVIKPSDTFRYKVKQIGMRKMTKVGSCRVVIEP